MQSCILLTLEVNEESHKWHYQQLVRQLQWVRFVTILVCQAQ